MAGFKTHITTSSVLGVGYTGVGIYLGLPLESSLIAGGLCSIGGMLPDIDSDSGIPFRESMGFAAALAPVLLLDRFHQFNLNDEKIVLICGAMYLFVRFGVARLLARYTVHRGMFHSLPAALTFAGVAFLAGGDCTNLQLRYFKASGVLLGVMSHLLLDEIYAVEWAGGRWRFKKSFGTAMKLWGKNGWANISTYAKLIIVALMILGEPAVMARYGQSQFALQREDWLQWNKPSSNQQIAQEPLRSLAPPTIQDSGNAQVAGGNPNSNFNQYGQSPPGSPPDWQASSADPSTYDPYSPQRDRTIYDTARRIWGSFQGEPTQQQPR